MKVSLAVAATLLLMPQAKLFAQSATLTVKDGRALVIGGETSLGEGLDATDLAPASVVEEFTRLCIPDPQSAGSRANTSPFSLKRDNAVFPASGKIGEANIARWTSKNASLFLWAGDDSGLKGRPIAMPSRAATTVGPYGPFRAFGEQCNLVIKISDLSQALVITELLTVQLGAPGKLVVKNTFADGYWITRDLRVNINIPTTRDGPQPVHLSVQLIPAGAK